MKLQTAWLILYVTMATLVGAVPSVAQDEEASGRKKLIEEVTTDDVKRFLDPVQMISRLSYIFQASSLPSDIKLYSHIVAPWYAINSWSAAWAQIPYRQFSFPDRNGVSGIGDVTLGWGFLAHEDATKRFTALAFVVEALLPTGDWTKGTGFETYIVAPRVAFAFNPTDKFPVFINFKYVHSIPTEADRPEALSQVRSFEIVARTFHILPKGFFLAFIPTYLWDIHKDFDLFSLGVGGGRALNPRLSIQGVYLQHVSGQKTFSRGFQVGLTYLFGSKKDK